jgi:GNAT superfamily N-acetyltransferase
MSFEIRPASQDERDRFVSSTWRRTFASPRSYGIRNLTGDYFSLHGSEGALVSKQLWLDAHAWIIARVLEHSSVAVASIGDECLGWVCWSPDQVHYVYVASRFRRSGVASALLRHALDSCDNDKAPSHITHDGEDLAKSLSREQPRATSVRQQGQAVHDG